MGHNFDTHAIVKRFVKSGLKEPQAEEIVKAITESREFDLANLATKSDIAAVRSEIKDLKIAMHEIKGDLLKWMIGLQLTTIFGLAGVMITVLKFML